MIPKIIHYCWFGGNPLDEKAKECIRSWHTFFPEYEIRCWDESNFDINQIPFMKDAYEHRKWAFVSDVARILLVYQYGGFYFDTDVEVVRSYEDILMNSPSGFLGIEGTQCVNTGLGFAAEKGNPFLAQLIDVYKAICFSDYIDSLQSIACPILMTELMEKEGYLRVDKLQSFRNFRVYPSSYFSPMDFDTGKLHMHKDTHSIHWGNASWTSDDSKKMRASIRRFNRIFGKKTGEKLFGVHSCIKEEGLLQYVKRHLKS